MQCMSEFSLAPENDGVVSTREISENGSRTVISCRLGAHHVLLFVYHVDMSFKLWYSYLSLVGNIRKVKIEIIGRPWLMHPYH